MATTTKALYRGAAATSSATLYTVPSSTTAIITNIAITNTAAAAATYTISLDGVVFAAASSIAANDTIIIDVKQVLATTKIIAGFASAVTVNFHICGVEIA
jgi:hypothetical protein